MTKPDLIVLAAFEQARAVDIHPTLATHQNQPAALISTSRHHCLPSRRSAISPFSSLLHRFPECLQQEHPGRFQSSSSTTHTISIRNTITHTRIRLFHPRGTTLHNNNITPRSAAGTMTFRPLLPLPDRPRPTTRIITMVARNHNLSLTNDCLRLAASKTTGSIANRCIPPCLPSIRCP